MTIHGWLVSAGLWSAFHISAVVTAAEPALPSKAQEILTKLETYEIEVQAQTRTQIELKQKQVVEALKAQLTEETKLGNLDGALAIQAEIDRLKVRPVAQAGEPKVRPAKVDSEAVFFEGAYYKFYDDIVDWKTAARRCKTKGGVLATVSSKSVNEFIIALTGKRGTWLGATDEEKEGDWRWLDGSKVDWANWHPNEPSNTGKKEHALRTVQDGGWADSDGERAILGYVCVWVVD